MLAISLTIACSRFIYNGFILHAHHVRGESHNQRNTTGEVATVQKATTIESSKAEQSTVKNYKGVDLAFFITKSSRNSLKFVFLSLSLLMHRMLNARKLSWNIATFYLIFNSSES